MVPSSPFWARMALRSSDDKAKCHGLSMKLALRLEFGQSMSNSVGIGRLDGISALVSVTGFVGFDIAKGRGLARHDPALSLDVTV